jgi:hypothetical protein
VYSESVSGGGSLLSPGLSARVLAHPACTGSEGTLWPFSLAHDTLRVFGAAIRSGLCIAAGAQQREMAVVVWTM